MNRIDVYAPGSEGFAIGFLVENPDGTYLAYSGDAEDSVNGVSKEEGFNFIYGKRHEGIKSFIQHHKKPDGMFRRRRKRGL